MFDHEREPLSRLVLVGLHNSSARLLDTTGDTLYTQAGHRSREGVRFRRSQRSTYYVGTMLDRAGGSRTMRCDLSAGAQVIQIGVLRGTNESFCR